MSRIYKQEQVIETVISEISCNRCGRKATYDDFIEWQEFISITAHGGYGSVFGDGTDIKLDLCQHCFKELLGKYIKLSFDDNF